MPLTLLAAIDIAGGQVARAEGTGPAGAGTGLSRSPLTVARAWAAAGAPWLHLVDLDAAYRRASNAAVIESVIAGLDVPVELSGGIQDDDSLRWALSTGAARVNLSAAALADEDWCRSACSRHGERLALSLDVRDGRLAPRGVPRWDRPLGLAEALDRLDEAGCGHYIVTDVTRDGTLAGPNVDLLREACARTTRPVIASGGVAGLDDLRQLAALEPAGLDGVIVGRALHAGAFTLGSALAVLGGQP